MHSENFNRKAQDYVNLLHLQPHPEGGFYKETYRAEMQAGFDSFGGMRNVSTGIYYLLDHGNFSAFHRIKSDEMWHFYDGTGLTVYVIHPQGDLEIIRLGKNLAGGETLQAVVPAGCWFASTVEQQEGFALVGCTVAPGFDFQDFELAKRESLIGLFPAHKELIHRLTRK